jgi:hypothetical protein
VVTDEELPSASTLSGVQLNISGILGPALAGILLTRVGAPVVFALNSLGFLLVVATIPTLQKTGSDFSQTLASFAHSNSSTFRYVRQTEKLRNILLRNTIFSSFIVVIPALAPVLLLRGCLKSPGRSRLTVRGPGFAPAVWKLKWGDIVDEI